MKLSDIENIREVLFKIDTEHDFAAYEEHSSASLANHLLSYANKDTMDDMFDEFDVEYKDMVLLSLFTESEVISISLDGKMGTLKLFNGSIVLNMDGKTTFIALTNKDRTNSLMDVINDVVIKLH